MKRYKVMFDYRALGGANKTYVAHVRAHNKGEAMIRAGVQYHQETGRMLPDMVESITVTQTGRVW